jgi:hypothetical protein
VWGRRGQPGGYAVFFAKLEPKQSRLLMLAAVVNLVALHARFMKLASVIMVSSLRTSSPCTLAPTAVTRRCLWCMESSSNIGCGSRR